MDSLVNLAGYTLEEARDYMMGLDEERQSLYT